MVVKKKFKYDFLEAKQIPDSNEYCESKVSTVRVISDNRDQDSEGCDQVNNEFGFQVSDSYCFKGVMTHPINFCNLEEIYDNVKKEQSTQKQMRCLKTGLQFKFGLIEA